MSFFDLENRGNVDEAPRKLNFPGVFGGKGGGVSSDPVLPVWFLRIDDNAWFAYLARIKRSMAESTSSASSGTGAFLFSGLYSLLEAMFPTFFMFW